MKNYNAEISKSTNWEDVKKVIDSYNNDINDNIECVLDDVSVKKAIAKLNKSYENAFNVATIANIKADRKTAFENLIKNPTFKKIVYKFNDNRTIDTEEKTAIFTFASLENAMHEDGQPLDENGNIIKDKSQTVFVARRFYGLCDAFIRNMLIANTTIDNEKIVDLSRIKIADKPIFGDDDGKAFASNSNNALEKQLNILVKFFGLEIKMLKKDLPILKLSAQKIKKDKANKASINEVKTLKFVDILFSVMTTRYNNEDIKIVTNDGKADEKVKG